MSQDQSPAERAGRPAKASMAALRRVLHALPRRLGQAELAGFELGAAQLAARHNLLAVIAASQLAPEVEALMRKARMAVGFQAERVRRGWERALDVLDGAKIAALPLKGRSLALRLYGDGGLRYSSDVDVLVGRGDFERALEAFRAAGYAVPEWVKPRY